MNRPEKNEYAPYYETYVSLVDETDIVAVLQNQLAELEDLVNSISEKKGSFSYAEGKWNIKQLIGHLTDGERVFAYRAFRISRGDKTPLASFEQDDYIANANFNNTTIADLIAEFSLLRLSNIILFKNLSEEAWKRTGTASDNLVSVRALAFIMAGHVRHHTKILKERYLSAE